MTNENRVKRNNIISHFIRAALSQDKEETAWQFLVVIDFVIRKNFIPWIYVLEYVLKKQTKKFIFRHCLFRLFSPFWSEQLPMMKLINFMFFFVLKFDDKFNWNFNALKSTTANAFLAPLLSLSLSILVFFFVLLLNNAK